MARGRFITNEKITVDVYKTSEGLRQLDLVSGIYFLVCNGSIDYIGRSTGISNRLTSHHVFDRSKHDEIWVYPVPHKEAWTQHLIEDDLIKHFTPPSNQAGLPKRK
jgi:hypothetical protein